MDNIVEFKRNSPAYYTSNATDGELHQAIERAEEIRQTPIDCIGHLPYAVLYGYEEIKTGKIKLLKEPITYKTRKGFEHQSEIKGHYAMAVIEEEIDYERFL